MRRAIDRRLAAAEQVARTQAPKFCIVRVRGGLPGEVRCAKIDGVHCERLPDETAELFEEQILATARSTKAKTVLFGGLCPCAWTAPGSFEEYLKGPDFRLFDADGIALEKPEDR